MSKQLFLAALSLFSRGAAGAGPFDVTADHVAWDDTTYTLTSRRPYPGSYQAWLPQSNGWVETILEHTLYLGITGACRTDAAAPMQVHWPGSGQPRSVPRGQQEQREHGLAVV